MKSHFKLQISQRKFSNGILFALFICMLVPSSVWAQQVTLSIDPPIVQAKIKPGKSILIAYSIENKGDPIALKYVIYMFAPAGQFGGVQLSPLEGPVEFTLENNDAIIDKPFFFNSNTRKQALVRISVPSITPNGDYYYMIVAETVPTNPAEGKTSSLASAQVGAPLLLSVTDSGITEVNTRIAVHHVVEGVDIHIGKKTYRVIDYSRPFTIQSIVENNGKNSVQPEGYIQVRSGSGISKFEILPQNILKTSSRILKTKQLHLPINASAVSTAVGFGKNTVSLQVSYGTGTQMQLSHVDIYAFPFRWLGILFAALIIGVVILTLHRKFRRSDKEDD